MPTNPNIRPDLLDTTIATPVMWAAAAALFVVWYLTHVLKHRLTTRPLQLGLLAGRIVLGTIALWVLYQAVSRHLLLETSWPLWTNALIGAVAIEFAMVVYQFEKRIVARRLGRWLLGLRLAAIGTVLTILVQPVFARDTTRTIERRVVVLVDDSGSMQIADPQMTVAEKLSLAAFYGNEAVKNHPGLEAEFTKFANATSTLDKSISGLNLPEGFGPEAESSLLSSQKPAISALLKDLPEATETLRKTLREQGNMAADAKQIAADLDQQMNNSLLPRLQEAGNAMNQGKTAETQSKLKQTREVAQRVLDRAAFLTEAADQVFYQTLSPELRKTIDDLATGTRAKLARDTMAQPRAASDGKSLTTLLQDKYTTQLVRFGKKSAEVANFEFPIVAEDQEFRMRTDLTTALTKISESYEPENLAGVLLLSDARHNTELPTDDVARKLGVQGSPIVPVLIGSARGSKDASILSVGSPQSLYEGDRIRTRVELKTDGLRGQEVKVRLLQDGTEVAQQTVRVPEDSYRTTVRLAYQPKTAGIFAHSVIIDPIEGEVYKNNNEWKFQTAVSDDRTNVLLIDDRPRWEFRYLRNLFDSRDKSVHLQYLLLHPDEVEGTTRPDKPASAAAKFGDSEATRLPAKPEDWKKFDVIILGDLPPASLGEATWNTIRECVEERGAMLVLIAGPNAMPHSYVNEAFRALCPVTYDPSTEAMLTPPEPAYKLMLTSEGRTNLIFEQSNSGMENSRIWESMPLLRWRHAITGVKDTASVLAYAQPATLDASGREVPQGPLSASLDPAALSKQKAAERKNALFVTSQAGAGKVAMLNFDHTWRFRYGVGDTYHHRFWGQLLRWGAGENLRAGNEYVRLGTDTLTYEPGAKIKIISKLIENDYRPIADASVTASIFKGTEKVASRELEFQKNSPGIYEGLLDGLNDPGDYTIELSGSEVERLAPDAVKTRFTIASASNPIEYGDLSVDREQATRLASLSQGLITTPATATQALEKFGPASTTKSERKETKLWDNWIILATFLGLVTTEWIARRKGGLI